MTTGIRLLIRPGGFMDPGEAERAERVLASARSILAVAALIAIYIDPTEPTRYYLLAYSVLVAYVLYSFGVVIALPLVKKPLRLQVPLHAAHLIWITVLTAFTQGPNTPFFVFFTFVLVSAAYR